MNCMSSQTNTMLTGFPVMIVMSVAIFPAFPCVLNAIHELGE
jgi:hypothetical protein